MNNVTKPLGKIVLIPLVLRAEAAVEGIHKKSLSSGTTKLIISKKKKKKKNYYIILNVQNLQRTVLLIQ